MERNSCQIIRGAPTTLAVKGLMMMMMMMMMCTSQLLRWFRVSFSLSITCSSSSSTGTLLHSFFIIRYFVSSDERLFVAHSELGRAEQAAELSTDHTGSEL